MTKVLITCDPESEALALQEMREIFPEMPPLTWVVDGVALATLYASFPVAAASLEGQAPIFVRHLAPVDHEIVLQGTDADPAGLTTALLEMLPRLDPARSFAVQSRIWGEGKRPYRKYTVNQTLSDVVQAHTHAVLDTRHPAQIISVACLSDRGYLGLSTAGQNWSLWPGGEHRFQNEPEQISRAEFKLLEAIREFDLPLPEAGTALDIGAAPGGWTRVLRRRGLKVVAVDPADLDPRLRPDRGVIHIRRQIQSYLPDAPGFDLIVNDMRMDALDSAAVMLEARSRLKPGGMAVMTLKLPKAIDRARDNLALVRLCLERLAGGYRILHTRQLFHNRSEVTTVLQSRL